MLPSGYDMIYLTIPWLLSLQIILFSTVTNNPTAKKPNWCFLSASWLLLLQKVGSEIISGHVYHQALGNQGIVRQLSA